jgi:hypothetical protein
MNTKCGKRGQERKISQAIHEELDDLYKFESKLLTLKIMAHIQAVQDA